MTLTGVLKDVPPFDEYEKIISASLPAGDKFLCAHVKYMYPFLAPPLLSTAIEGNELTRIFDESKVPLIPEIVCGYDTADQLTPPFKDFENPILSSTLFEICGVAQTA